MTIDPLRAIRELASQGGASWLWGQVRVEAGEPGQWRLRHTSDSGVEWHALRRLAIEELLEWGDVDRHGSFRPLRSAPTLRDGWGCEVPDLGLLEDALNRLYPGSVADWWAFKEHGATAATSFREFVNRQTGMYRSAQQLPAAAAEAAVRACCAPDICQKRRIWTVDSLGPSDRGSFPCLEPCAVALEMARQAAKLERGPQVTLTLPESALQTLVFALSLVVSRRIIDGVGHEEGKLDAPHNTRRIKLLLERIQPELARVSDASAK